MSVWAEGVWGNGVWADDVWFGMGGEETPVVSTPRQSGVKNRRRWAVRKEDKYYYFDDLRKLESFVRESEAAQIIIPKQVRKKAGVEVKVLEGPGAYDIFDRIRRRVEDEAEAQKQMLEDEDDLEAILLD